MRTTKTRVRFARMRRLIWVRWTQLSIGTFSQVSAKFIDEPEHDKTYSETCAPSKDSDQPAHPRSLIRVFADRMYLLQPSSYPKKDKRKPLTYWVDVQADQSLCWLHRSTVLSTSPRKTVFAWCFILNENILFWLTISYKKTFVVSVSVFCSQIYILKLNLRPNICLTCAISMVKWLFGNFVYENIFYFSLLVLNYWCFTTILWKFQKKWISGTCWKSASKLSTLQISA